MRVGIDAHAIGTGAGGNETYMRSLLAALYDHGDDTEIVAIVNEADHAQGHRAVPLRSRMSTRRILAELPRLARTEDLDVLHTQFHVPLKCACTRIVSVHDIGWVIFPEFYTRRLRWRLNGFMPDTLRRAARVFTLTAAVRDELVQHYAVSSDRIDVVAPGVEARYHPHQDPADIAAVRRRYRLPARYILYVGAIQPRKNLVRLAKAFAYLRRREGLEHPLVLAGPEGPMSDGVLAEIEALDIEYACQLIGYVPLNDMAPLIGGADAFVYPSIYEGFGLPVLEAMACGVPVLTSTAPALKEVAGDAALCVDPLDVPALTDGLRRVLRDESLRERLRHAGPARAQAYQPFHMAKSALAGYEAALR